MQREWERYEGQPTQSASAALPAKQQKKTPKAAFQAITFCSARNQMYQISSWKSGFTSDA